MWSKKEENSGASFFNCWEYCYFKYVNYPISGSMSSLGESAEAMEWSLGAPTWCQWPRHLWPTSWTAPVGWLTRWPSTWGLWENACLAPETLRYCMSFAITSYHLISNNSWVFASLHACIVILIVSDDSVVNFKRKISLFMRKMTILRHRSVRSKLSEKEFGFDSQKPKADKKWRRKY